VEAEAWNVHVSRLGGTAQDGKNILDLRQVCRVNLLPVAFLEEALQPGVTKFSDHTAIL
jgi:hypothetical protein